MNIKSLRIAAGMTQEQFAAELSIERSTVSKWETGEAKPRTDTLLRIAMLLGCSVDDLFTDESKKGN